MELLQSEEDWAEVLAEINAYEEYQHFGGNPPGYPCAVESNSWENEDGLLFYTHTFWVKTQTPTGTEAGTD